MIKALDHITLVVSDLAATGAGYSRLLGPTSGSRGMMHGADHFLYVRSFL